MARSLKFWILKVEGLYYPCSENKGADQLRVFVVAYAKSRFSHNEAHIFLEFAWRQWPDDSRYSIPKSVYGCPEQSLNKWVEGYIDIRFQSDDDTVLMEKTLGPITQEKTLYTIGPFQPDGFRLSFCSKNNLSVPRESNRDTEWPRGNYAIFLLDFSDSCPEGKRKRLSIRLIRPFKDSTVYNFDSSTSGIYLCE